MNLDPTRGLILARSEFGRKSLPAGTERPSKLAPTMPQAHTVSEEWARLNSNPGERRQAAKYAIATDCAFLPQCPHGFAHGPLQVRCPIGCPISRAKKKGQLNDIELTL